MNPTLSGVIGPGCLNQVPTLAFIGPWKAKQLQEALSQRVLGTVMGDTSPNHNSNS